MIWRTHIDILMLGKCYPLSQLRGHEAKMQITHAEHYRESDILFIEQVLLNNAYWQSINTKNDILIEHVKYSCQMKTKFLWTRPCWKDIENSSVVFSLISSICIIWIVYMKIYVVCIQYISCWEILAKRTWGKCVKFSPSQIYRYLKGSQ